MWLPRWLAQQYGKLYGDVRSNEFTFDEALQVLDSDGQWGRVVLSALRRRGFLDILARKRKRRIYKLAQPEETVILLGKDVDLLKVPDAIRPVLRPYVSGLFERLKNRVISIVLYGSFARGDYHENSDIDLLLVIDAFKWSESLSIPNADELVYRLWELRRVYYAIQPYPLTPEQARLHRPLYLDIVEDGIILYDKDRFLTNVFEAVRHNLQKLGAVRHDLLSGAWYWDLKPTIREGEIIEV